MSLELTGWSGQLLPDLSFHLTDTGMVIASLLVVVTLSLLYASFRASQNP